VNDTITPLAQDILDKHEKGKLSNTGLVLSACALILTIELSKCRGRKYKKRNKRTM
jgi:hypothetical protein